MAIRINLSLAELNRQYTVFERNQVLSDVQLNGVTEYLNDQDRLSRLLLLGVGVHGGLRVFQTKSAISVTKGVGVTTDADLLWLDDTVTFSRFRKYDETAPRYDPFYDGETMREVFELIPDGAEDAEPLTEFPQNLDDLVVVLFMESHLDDPDCASGTTATTSARTRSTLSECSWWRRTWPTYWRPNRVRRARRPHCYRSCLPSGRTSPRT